MAPATPKQLQIGARLPDIVGESQVGIIRAHDYLQGSWALICTFPRTNHPVWMTELGMLQKLKDEFEARSCRLLAMHIDSDRQQADFIRDVESTQGVKLSFPVISDRDGEIARRLGLVPPTAPKHAADVHRLPFSCTILLDLDLTVRFLSYTPDIVGRNLYESIRILDAFQTSLFNQVVTPANWKASEDVFIEPDVTNDAAKELFPQGFYEITPYSRITASPSQDE